MDSHLETSPMPTLEMSDVAVWARLCEGGSTCTSSPHVHLRLWYMSNHSNYVTMLLVFSVKHIIGKQPKLDV